MASNTQLIEQFGPWALVTGASSGIGAEFCRQLAAAGLNLVMVARRTSVLTQIAEEIKSTNPVSIKLVVADLSVPEEIQDLFDQTQSLDIGSVFSVAGDGAMGAFHTVELPTLLKMIRVNIEAQVQLAHHFGCRILKQRQGRGGLLLTSSTTAFQGVPYAGDYAASKAYLLSLGEALHAELKATGVHVTTLVPGPTRTPGIGPREDIDFSKIPMKPMEAEAVVSAGIRALARNKAVAVPGVMNKLMTGFMGRKLMTRAANVALWGKLMADCIPTAGKLPRLGN